MKIFKRILIALAMVLVFIPVSTKADTKYNTLNLEGALSEEKIEHDLSNYSENDDQAIIYLFRGRGCGYCRKFLTFLNSIVDDYGKYFKVVSYEVWNDEENSKLLSEISKITGEDAGGVPYIVIGDKVFAGYSENYDDQIKSKIKEMYDTKKSDRYDVMEEYAKGDSGKSDKDDSSNFSIIVFNAIFTLAAVAVVTIYDSKKRIDLENRISELEAKKSSKKN